MILTFDMPHQPVGRDCPCKCDLCDIDRVQSMYSSELRRALKMGSPGFLIFLSNSELYSIDIT